MRHDEELQKKIKELENEKLTLQAKIVMLESKVEFLVDIINKNRKEF